jgi:membrane-bound metal-dependent hydrolase YbcI (DUF457 family)
MPTPLGHAIGAVACSWLITGTGGDRRTNIRRALVLATVGMAPDLDLLIDRHSAETHSLGAAAIVATVAAVMRWPVAEGRLRIWCAVAIAWASHPLLDALGRDGSAPFGVMLWWPLSREHFMASVSVFDPISRRWWLPGFVSHNLAAVWREVLILVPAMLMAWFMTRSGTRAKRPPPQGHP